MRDPIIKNDLGLITAEVKFEAENEITTLSTFVDKDIVRELSQEELEQKLKEEIAKVALKPGTEIYRSAVAFSYSDDDALEGFDFGNVLIQAHIPYCLHLPDYYSIKVLAAEHEIEALITFEKIWTERAIDGDQPSDRTDFLSESRTTYFNKSTILAPQLPFNPIEGWDSKITGRNIERVGDQNGQFRYSRLHIQLNEEVPNNIEELSDSSRERILKGLQKKALTSVNRLIDNYRDITDEIHVRRLAFLKTNLIYFIDHDIGFYMVDMNIRTAMMNRPHEEVKKIKSQSESGKKPDLYKMLLLNARNSLAINDYIMSVVESFQALEIFLENYLISAFKDNGIEEDEYKELLNRQWQTKTRLNDVLYEVKGIKLNSQNNIWNRWCLRYDQTRNKVLHSGKEPTSEETRETIEVNEEVINWLNSL